MSGVMRERFDFIRSGGYNEEAYEHGILRSA